MPCSNQPPQQVIVRKNFSLLLALRYLNPLRTHVSVITLISLAGVAIGVMVLIVVVLTNTDKEAEVVMLSYYSSRSRTRSMWTQTIYRSLRYV